MGGLTVPLGSPNSHSDHSSSRSVHPLDLPSALGPTTTTAKVSVSNQLRLRFRSVIWEVPKITSWPGAGQKQGGWGHGDLGMVGRQGLSGKPALEVSLCTGVGPGGCGLSLLWSMCGRHQPVLWTPHPQSSSTPGQIPKRESGPAKTSQTRKAFPTWAGWAARLQG